MQNQHEAAAARLRLATRNGTPCAPVRDILGAADVDAAYAVQAANVEQALHAGRHRVGRKIGLTSPAVQRQLGVYQPDFGTLLDDMRVPPGGAVDPRRLLQPKAEAEVAFVLARDIDEPVTSTAGVRAAVAYAAPAIEIVDSRIAGWDISIVDTIADNASSGLFVLGHARVEVAGLDLAAATMTLARNAAVDATGSGAACLGDPLNALLWLATTALAYGDPLRAGEVVLSGALGPMLPVKAGDELTATISPIGSVHVRFDGHE